MEGTHTYSEVRGEKYNTQIDENGQIIRFISVLGNTRNYWMLCENGLYYNYDCNSISW